MSDDKADAPPVAPSPWAPLQAQAALTRPSAQALARAALLMARMGHAPAGRTQHPSPADITTNASPQTITAAAPSPASGPPTAVAQAPCEALPRRYRHAWDLARAWGLTLDAAAHAASWPYDEPVAPRPQVRPGVRRRAAPDSVSQELLEELVDSLQIEAASPQAPQFVVTFRQEALGAVSCVLRVEDRGVVATFLAGDQDTYRLLTAEVPQLRAQLEARGLAVAQVDVLRASDDL